MGRCRACPSSPRTTAGRTPTYPARNWLPTTTSTSTSWSCAPIPHVYEDLTEIEYFAVSWRYGLTGSEHSMKNLAAELGCNHAQARAVLGGALDKLRQRLITR